MATGETRLPSIPEVNSTARKQKALGNVPDMTKYNLLCILDGNRVIRVDRELRDHR
jgi:hypothetical protein